LAWSREHHRALANLVSALSCRLWEDGLTIATLRCRETDLQRDRPDALIPFYSCRQMSVKTLLHIFLRHNADANLGNNRKYYCTYCKHQTLKRKKEIQAMSVVIRLEERHGSGWSPSMGELGGMCRMTVASVMRGCRSKRQRLAGAEIPTRRCVQEA
jgi:hypothetical protein